MILEVVPILRCCPRGHRHHLNLSNKVHVRSLVRDLVAKRTLRNYFRNKLSENKLIVRSMSKKERNENQFKNTFTSIECLHSKSMSFSNSVLGSGLCRRGRRSIREARKQSSLFLLFVSLTTQEQV